MGLYNKYVLPRLINLVMQDRATTQCRSEIIPRARGRVVEVGIGSGLNLPFYGSDVEHVWGVDPSRELLSMTRSKIEKLPFTVELLCESAEKTRLEDDCADTVVLTWSLCTIPDTSSALAEMRRVLKPDGKIIFAEHGLAPDRGVRNWQERTNPWWKRIAGGCNLNRKIDELITGGGFEIQELRKSYLPGPRFLSYTYEGIAT